MWIFLAALQPCWIGTASHLRRVLESNKTVNHGYELNPDLFNCRKRPLVEFFLFWIEIVCFIACGDVALGMVENYSHIHL